MTQLNIRKQPRVCGSARADSMIKVSVHGLKLYSAHTHRYTESTSEHASRKKEERKNIQAADRREEERQAGCHTSKTGTQLQQTAERTRHGGEEKVWMTATVTKTETVFTAELLGQSLCSTLVQGSHKYMYIYTCRHLHVSIKKWRQKKKPKKRYI